MAGIDGLGSRNTLFNGSFGVGGSENVGKGNDVGGGVGGQKGPLPPGGGVQSNTLLDTLFTPPSDNQGAQNRLANSENAPSLKEFEAALRTLLDAVRDPDMLSKLMIEMSSMSRQNALDARLQARSQARGELEGQAAETKEAAQKMLVSAIVGLVLAVASAVISIVGAAKSMSASKDAASHSKDAIQANKIMDNAGDGISNADKLKLSHQASASETLGKIAQTKADVTNQVTSALAGLANAIKSATEGGLNAASKMDEAEGQMLAAAAQDSQANADMVKQFMDELQELIRSALQFLKDMMQAETDMMATASRL